MVEVDEKEYDAYQLLPGDILLNRVNTPELVGKCAVVTDEVGKAIFESKNIRIRIKKDIAAPDYVVFYLNSPQGYNALRNGVKHAIGMATLNNTDLRAVSIMLPNLNMQMKWSDMVQEMRHLRKKRLQSGNTINALFGNLLHRAFSGDLTAKWR
ncbi:MAG TPA: hypothetical protein DCP92_09960, partial [Nitrospiraceae bacterium]|nr:hypothetical protein [Nitrospiraceae bacterium]